MSGPRTAGPGTRILTDVRGQSSWLVRPARLTVVEGPDAGRAVEVGPVPLTVGADACCDLVLSDPAVSSRHVQLVVDEQGLCVRDLGSTNGTYVEELRVGVVHLRQPASIRVGQSVLRVEQTGEERTLALSRATNFGGLLGHSPAMRAVFAMLEAAARSDATVLLLGESGTGKELAARALHERSARREGPFVVFDAGAASPTLVESQLFGHARGAFTGATEARAGCFEAAHGGTLVLDEIGELPIELQPKLLRVLEQRCVVRLGEVAERPVDVRVVASTNRNLEEEVRAGRFRQDLYFRLAVVTVRLPPLRERREEIARLARHFAVRAAGERAPELPPDVLRVLEAHDWPGNVRELRNFVERWLVLPEVATAELRAGDRQPRSGVADAGAMPDVSLPYHEAKERWIERFERAYLERLLHAHGGNITEAARVAGLSRQTCYRLMHKHGLGPA
ncbi:MAG: sigma 54-interacting transcriptional regulator [Myxococcota bacterium]|nr:sigma 54-interacting transcriptional regulator [Myxococcota bacterium]MDW8362689.1 sigma 54-interacting transcriptional regulator [Myxococcales bacterium]